MKQIPHIGLMSHSPYSQPSFLANFELGQGCYEIHNGVPEVHGLAIYQEVGRCEERTNYRSQTSKSRFLHIHSLRSERSLVRQLLTGSVGLVKAIIIKFDQILNHGDGVGIRRDKTDV